MRINPPIPHQRYRRELPILVAVLILALVIPYGYAAAVGTAEAGNTGLGILVSAARSTYCQEGANGYTAILLFETGLLMTVTLLAYALPGKLGVVGAAFRRHGFLLTVFIFLVALPNFVAWQTDSSVCARGKSFFWQSILIEVFILAILAISYNLMFGFTGVVSFGHAAFFGIGAYGVGLLSLHLEWPLLFAVLASLTVSILMGLFVSVIALRIHGLYFAIFTLAFAEIFFVLSQNRILTEITGAEDGFTFPVPDWINATLNRLTFYYLALAFLVLSYVFVKRLVNSPTGKVMNALRDNEDRAMMLGYNTFIFKTISILVASSMATGAGILRGLLNKGASPNVLGISFTVDPLLMTLIGGTGSFTGPVIGAFFLRLSEQLLRDTIVSIGGVQVNIGERWALILGVLFIASVLVFPLGIVGTTRNWARKISARLQTRSSS